MNWHHLFHVIASTLLFFLAIPTSLLAHGELIDAEPAPGATLDAAPSEIRLTFSQPNREDSRIELYGTGFQQIDNVYTKVNSDRSEQLIATLPPLDKGHYTVQWIIHSQDGHEQRGSYMFVALEATPTGISYQWWWIAAGVLLICLLWVVWRKYRTVTSAATSDEPAH